MNIFSHLMMGNLLYKNFRNINISLDRRAFVFGNIKPDISSEYRKIPHYKKYVFKFFCKQVNSLSSEKLSDTNKISAEYSEKLGVICHYISDFFCYAHCESFDSRGWNHFFYEMQLYFYMLRRRRSMKNLSRMMEYDIKYDTAHLFEELEKANKEYISSHKSEGMDVACALESCIRMVLAVIEISINSEEKVEVGDYENSVFYRHVLSRNKRSRQYTFISH